MSLFAFIRRHLFDILIIAAIILTVGSLLWYRQSKKDTWVTVAIRVMNDEWWWPGQNPEKWYAGDLKVGDKAFDSFGRPVAEITRLDLADVGDSRLRSTVYVKLLVKYDTRKQLYLHNFQPLQVGKSIDLGFGDHSVKGVVASVNHPDQPLGTTTVNVKITKVNPWVADSFKVGMKTTVIEGQPNAEILAMRVTPNIARVFSDRRGEMVQVTNADYRDVYATLRLPTYQVGQVFYFTDSAELKIGNEIWLHFPTTVMKKAEIMEINPPIQ